MATHLLKTSRLELIPWQTQEAASLFQLFSTPSVRRYLWDDAPVSLESVVGMLTLNEQLFAENGFGLWKVTHADRTQTLGFAGLWFFFQEDQPQLLYGLWQEQEGNGYATEASQAVLKHAFHRLDFSYVDAAIDTPHTQSRQVLERLGMRVREKRIEAGKPTTFFRLYKQAADA